MAGVIYFCLLDMKTSILFASGNPGKTREVQVAFKNLAMDIIPQSRFNLAEVDETGCTFVENALLKARYAAQQTGLPTLSDDSGLMVSALKNAPGVYSARYAGPNANANQNIEKLLTDLKNVPTENRAAQFYCVLVYLSHAEDPCPIICQAKWEGAILVEPRGTAGFGYDPIFYVPSYDCSAAELPIAIKNQISHRGQALQQMVEALIFP
jgi:XTP/dITP diphosphohydrolase